LLGATSITWRQQQQEPKLQQREQQRQEPMRQKRGQQREREPVREQRLELEQQQELLLSYRKQPRQRQR